MGGGTGKEDVRGLGTEGGAGNLPAGRGAFSKGRGLYPRCPNRQELHGVVCTLGARSVVAGADASVSCRPMIPNYSHINLLDEPSTVPTPLALPVDPAVRHRPVKGPSGRLVPQMPDRADSATAGFYPRCPNRQELHGVACTLDARSGPSGRSYSHHRGGVGGFGGVGRAWPASRVAGSARSRLSSWWTFRRSGAR